MLELELLHEKIDAVRETVDAVRETVDALPMLLKQMCALRSSASCISASRMFEVHSERHSMCLPVSCSVFQCRAVSSSVLHSSCVQPASPFRVEVRPRQAPWNPRERERGNQCCRCRQRGMELLAELVDCRDLSEQSTCVNNVSNGQADGPRGLRVNSVRRLLARDVKVYIHVYISYTDIYMYTRVYIHVYM